ncbi:VTT domain-containing protein [bacterium]|nr:VTT domain-containing protein [bacterium]
MSPLEHLGTFTYVIGFLFVFLESLIIVGHLFPGTLFMALLGFMCYQGIFDFWNMVLVIFLGHFLGEMANYLIGRRWGRGLFRTKRRFLNLERLRQIEEQFEARGGEVILISRFVGLIRTFVGVIAGMAHYPLGRYTLIMAVSDYLWAFVHIGVGYVLGASWQHAARYVEGISLLLLVLILVIWFSVWLVRELFRNVGQVVEWLRYVAERLQRTERLRALRYRYPRAVAFVEARLSLNRPWGGGATFGFFVSLVLILIFLNVFQSVRSGPIWTHVDESLLNLIAQLRSPAADGFFIWVAHFSAMRAIVLVGMASAVAAALLRQNKSAVIIAGSVAAATVLCQAFGLPGYAFPSRNTAISIALAVALLFWMWSHPGSFGIKMSIASVMLSFILIAVFARFYLGIQLPSGMWGGFWLGLACAVFCATLFKSMRLLSETRRRTDYAAAAGIALGMGLAWISFIVHPVATRIGQPAPVGVERVTSLRELIGHLPRNVMSVVDRPMLPIDLVLIGDPAALTARLETEGWRRVRSDAFFTTMVQAPIFPGFVDRRPQQITMLKQFSGRRLVLRLWPARFELGGRGVWVGSVIAEQARTMFLGVADYDLAPDLDATMDEFASQLKGMRVQKIEWFRKRGLYPWRQVFFTHGGALAVEVEE